MLQVHNEGEAIPENAMKTIFEPMVRHQTEGQESDKNGSGLGLGLYIASEIATAHSGTIDVTSTATAGTMFTVKIPRHPTAKKPLPDRSPRPWERSSEVAEPPM